MKFTVYALRDKHTGFLTPTYEQSDAAAQRNFAKAVNQTDGLLNFAPADFDLYKIGYFDTVNGLLEPINPVEFVVSGNSLIGAKG